MHITNKKHEEMLILRLNYVYSIIFKLFFYVFNMIKIIKSSFPEKAMSRQSAAFPEIERVILFGSRAADDANSFLDVNRALFCPGIAGLKSPRRARG